MAACHLLAAILMFFSKQQAWLMEGVLRRLSPCPSKLPWEHVLASGTLRHSTACDSLLRLHTMQCALICH